LSLFCFLRGDVLLLNTLESQSARLHVPEEQMDRMDVFPLPRLILRDDSSDGSVISGLNCRMFKCCRLVHPVSFHGDPGRLVLTTKYSVSSFHIHTSSVIMMA